MIPIIKQMCPSSRYNLKCPYTREPDRIVIHNSANDAPAKNEIAYMISRPEEISFHLAIDDREVVQGLPFERNAWAASDGCGPGNMKGIHIEICYSLSGGARFIEAERNAARYTALLLHKYGWGIDRVTKHRDYVGKYCPHRTLDMGWQRFINMVKKYLNEYREEIDMTKEELRKLIEDVQNEMDPLYDTLEDVPSYWREDIKALMEKGIILGEGEKLNLRRSTARCAVLIHRATRGEG